MVRVAFTLTAGGGHRKSPRRFRVVVVEPGQGVVGASARVVNHLRRPPFGLRATAFQSCEQIQCAAECVSEIRKTTTKRSPTRPDIVFPEGDLTILFLIIVWSIVRGAERYKYYVGGGSVFLKMPTKKKKKPMIFFSTDFQDEQKKKSHS